ncbi:META domain-containing protein [Persicobacter psychrovividus]|uniref:META domain-containing protein n=1 Tax=Persicobacter psychrovividus TaxID=387638 RepID=A0ABM7VJ51_9BACT|nr:hypothetical protein PEPS_33060 [Persicobacter psychrovividus]
MLKNGLLILAISLFSFSCKSSKEALEENIINLKVAPFQVACMGVSERECMVVQKDTADFSLFYSGIEGFDFQEGKAYQLTVAVEQVPNPPADGSSLRYILRSSKEIAVAKTLEGSAWQVTKIAGEQMPSAAALTLEFKEGKVSGFSGCNRFFGQAEIMDGLQLKMGPLAGTRKFCEGQMKQEQMMMDALNKADHFWATGDSLMLFEGNQLLLEAVK